MEAMEDVIADLETNTAHQGYDYYTQATIGFETAYGHGACNGKLSHEDCDSCIVTASATIESFCAAKFGGQLQLVDCRIRYENYDFRE